MSFFRCYKAHRFTKDAQATVDQANQIIGDMTARGYVLTLRQLYYQFVARDLIPNEERQYKRLGRIVTRAREAGIMDWQAIEDRGRTCYRPQCEEDPADVVSDIEFGLHFDQWARQDTYLEVWVEKSALEGVIAKPCDKFEVPYMACKGYLSASEAWRAGLRFRRAQRNGKNPILIHLADHDPSGLHMTVDNRHRLEMFAETYDVEVQRIALNMDQIEEHNPPPNPAKQTDSRYAGYADQFGDESWELDALDPEILDTLISDKIKEYVDQDIWDQTLEEEAEARKPLAALSENWYAVQRFLEDEGLV